MTLICRVLYSQYLKWISDFCYDLQSTNHYFSWRKKKDYVIIKICGLRRHVPLTRTRRMSKQNVRHHSSAMEVIFGVHCMRTEEADAVRNRTHTKRHRSATPNIWHSVIFSLLKIHKTLQSTASICQINRRHFTFRMVFVVFRSFISFWHPNSSEREKKKKRVKENSLRKNTSKTRYFFNRISSKEHQKITKKKNQV